MKKIFKIALYVLVAIIFLLIPTALIVVHYMTIKIVPEYLYFVPIIILVLIALIVFIWKKIYSLFTLSIGFLISPMFIPIGLSLLGIRRLYPAGFGGEGMTTAFWFMFYALPFAFITLIIAFFILLWKRNRKSSEKQHLLANDEEKTND